MTTVTRKPPSPKPTLSGESPKPALDLVAVFSKMAADSLLAATRGWKGTYTVELHYQMGKLNAAKRRGTGSRSSSVTPLEDRLTQNRGRLDEAGRSLQDLDKWATGEGASGMVGVILEYEAGVILRVSEVFELLEK